MPQPSNALRLTISSASPCAEKLFSDEVATTAHELAKVNSTSQSKPPRDAQFSIAAKLADSSDTALAVQPLHRFGLAAKAAHDSAGCFVSPSSCAGKNRWLWAAEPGCCANAGVVNKALARRPSKKRDEASYLAHGLTAESYSMLADRVLSIATSSACRCTPVFWKTV